MCPIQHGPWAHASVSPNGLDPFSFSCFAELTVVTNTQATQHQHMPTSSMHCLRCWRCDLMIYRTTLCRHVNAAGAVGSCRLNTVHKEEFTASTGLTPLTVCVSLRQPTTVCLFAYLKNHATALYQILCMHVALARSSSDVVVICYVLPVLRVISSRVTRERYSRNYCTSFKNIFLDDKDYQVHVVTCALGAKSAILDCLIASENES